MKLGDISMMSTRPIEQPRQRFSPSLRVISRPLATPMFSTLLLLSFTPGAAGALAPDPAIRAVTASSPIRLDGRLDEPCWAEADSITDFRQREPAEGAPASERTVVKLARDADALYVGVRAEDRDVRRIRASQLRRDADLEGDDTIMLLIDSFCRRRGAFVFETNPHGAMWDAEVGPEQDVDDNWDGIWFVATARDSAGWSAEFQIPFRTLRFHSAERVDFGYNVRRFIRRKNEEVLWRSFGRAQGLYQLQNEGAIVDLDELHRGLDLELRPYAMGRVEEGEHDLDGFQTTSGLTKGKFGVDAKLAPAPTLTTDLTYNTDFAQAEVDRQVINLTRFPTFFPEKRQFFLESNSFFNFGSQSSALLFYSRRIGLRDSVAVPLVAGARLYGRLRGWSLGGLDARTGSGDDANNFAVRVRRDLLERAYLGGIVTVRSGPGVAGYERAAGVDIDLPLVVDGKNLEPSAWVAATRKTGGSTPAAWKLATDYPNDQLDCFASVYRVSADFDPTLGFVDRSGVVATRGHVEFTPRPNRLSIRQLDFKLPIPSWEVLADEHGSLTHVSDWQSAVFEWRPLGGEFQSGDQFEVNIQRFLEALSDTFEIFHGVDVSPGHYWWSRGEIQYRTSPGRPLSANLTASVGDFYDGRNKELSLGATWRGGGHLILGADFTQDKARLPGGDFHARQAAMRVELAFTRAINLLVFGQYNIEDERADFYARLHWMPVIGDDVYMVWNSGYTTDPAARFKFPSRDALDRPLNGALMLKVVHRIAP